MYVIPGSDLRTCALCWPDKACHRLKFSGGRDRCGATGEALARHEEDGKRGYLKPAVGCPMLLAPAAKGDAPAPAPAATKSAPAPTPDRLTICTARPWVDGAGVATEVPADSLVSFVAPDGRTAFTLRLGDDGRSLHIIAVQPVKLGGVLYDNRLTVEPMSTNVVNVALKPYGDR